MLAATNCLLPLLACTAPQDNEFSPVTLPLTTSTLPSSSPSYSRSARKALRIMTELFPNHVALAPPPCSSPSSPELLTWRTLMERDRRLMQSLANRALLAKVRRRRGEGRGGGGGEKDGWSGDGYERWMVCHKPRSAAGRCIVMQVQGKGRGALLVMVTGGGRGMVGK